MDPSPRDLGPALAGHSILYLWLEDGWQHGTVARASRLAQYIHMVVYHLLRSMALRPAGPLRAGRILEVLRDNKSSFNVQRP